MPENAQDGKKLLSTSKKRLHDDTTDAAVQDKQEKKERPSAQVVKEIMIGSQKTKRRSEAGAADRHTA